MWTTAYLYVNTPHWLSFILSYVGLVKDMQIETFNFPFQKC